VSDVRKPVSIDVYYDFLCPWAFRGAEWLRDVQKQLGPDKLKINWRFFPLEQVNSDGGPDWKLWEQPDDYESRGLGMFKGALAAWNQDQGEKFERFHQLMYQTRHGEFTVDGERPDVRKVAEIAGLDMEKFDRDYADRSLLSRIGEDYNHARDTYGVFGVPTLVFENGEAAYLKILPKPSPEEAVAFWDEISNTIANRPSVYEIKRPTPPTA
jgi:predicted DsbA family dithiol-disulfide isomerase